MPNNPLTHPLFNCQPVIPIFPPANPPNFSSKHYPSLPNTHPRFLTPHTAHPCPPDPLISQSSPIVPFIQFSLHPLNILAFLIFQRRTTLFRRVHPQIPLSHISHNISSSQRHPPISPDYHIFHSFLHPHSQFPTTTMIPSPVLAPFGDGQKVEEAGPVAVSLHFNSCWPPPSQ